MFLLVGGGYSARLPAPRSSEPGSSYLLPAKTVTAIAGALLCRAIQEGKGKQTTGSGVGSGWEGRGGEENNTSNEDDEC